MFQVLLGGRSLKSSNDCESLLAPVTSEGPAASHAGLTHILGQYFQVTVGRIQERPHIKKRFYFSKENDQALLKSRGGQEYAKKKSKELLG